MSTLNAACQEFYEQIKCYKAELAYNMKAIIQSYNSIFLQQYETFFKTDSEKEKMYSQ